MPTTRYPFPKKVQNYKTLKQLVLDAERGFPKEPEVVYRFSNSRVFLAKKNPYS